MASRNNAEELGPSSTAKLLANKLMGQSSLKSYNTHRPSGAIKRPASRNVVNSKLGIITHAKTSVFKTTSKQIDGQAGGMAA